MAKMPKELGAAKTPVKAFSKLGAAKTPVKAFSKLGAAPTAKTPATMVTPKAAEAKAAKPASNRLANLGAFAHPAKKKKS